MSGTTPPVPHKCHVLHLSRHIKTTPGYVLRTNQKPSDTIILMQSRYIRVLNVEMLCDIMFVMVMKH